MHIYRDINGFPELRGAVVTLGSFDGVHRGHQELLSAVVAKALSTGGESVVISFDPPPRLALDPFNSEIRLLNTPEEKEELIGRTNVDHFLILPFDNRLANRTPEDFVQHYLSDIIHSQRIILGYDHHFGKGGKGNIFTLKLLAPQYGFEVEKIESLDIEGSAVSSTRIREAVLSGDLRDANNLLGYPYRMTGKIVEGDKIGRTLGFPTANLEVTYPWKLIPARGVYAVRVKGNGFESPGMCNIGIRPTLGGNTQTIEINIFDFDRDIYGETLSIEMLTRIREERKHTTLNDLKAQLADDESRVRKLIS